MNIILSKDEIRYIKEVLSLRPYNECALLIAKIQEQENKQEEEK